MSGATHWASHYIGLPYAPPARDCWGFVREIWRAHFGLAVPGVWVDASDTRAVLRAFRDHPERQAWVEVPAPAEGDAVLMAHNRHPAHVGVWVAADNGGVLHCERPHGVMFAKPAALARAGWARLRYYRRAA